MNDKIYTFSELRDIILPIITKYKADKAFLFGSYARNEANKDSDIDVLVIGGDRFDTTDIFCIADELHRASSKKVDVYEESEIGPASAFYNNILKDMVKL
ncbi:MAG: nucleotidyltransferase domain-containing protein [Lachnospiraceae bacterium]|nr:nucleotidyltransferase domain-containing protein [Lachnospiraceae bacterium]